uniref:SAYSVFN motif domain containing 1 n=1 Tax=Falco tinnunculus TaxID=100819 RepID=A0A8C4UDD3_FALTI
SPISNFCFKSRRDRPGRLQQTLVLRDTGKARGLPGREPTALPCGWQPLALGRSQLLLPRGAQATLAVPATGALAAMSTSPGVAAPVWARPLLLKVLLWAVLLALFAELELGLPYLVLSGLYWMYAGTRGPAERRQGELSAYSVFNPGCAAIAGTLTAEQLERELHYRPAAGR